jgi:ribonuclease-3
MIIKNEVESIKGGDNIPAFKFFVLVKEPTMSRVMNHDGDNMLDELEKTIGYRFRDKGKLKLALTHSSYANERKSEGLSSNERLEFLGDSVLSIITSDYIYRNHPELPEGEMTKTRAAIVCESSLMKCAEKIRLGDYLYLGRGEENTGGRKRTSILSDAFEALIGAIYLDGGIAMAGKFILWAMEDIYRDMKGKDVFRDYKTQFQEIIQKQSDQQISYRIIDERGPDHDKVFISELFVGNKPYGKGEGRTKKEAEQNAARAAMDKMTVEKQA